MSQRLTILLLFFCLHGSTQLFAQKTKKTYTVNGMKTELEGSVSLNKFIPHGIVKTYHPNGKIALEGAYQNGKASGIWKQYYPNGILKTENTYINGIMHGQFIKYYDNGKKAAEWTYIQGNIDGTVKYFFKSGKQKGSYTYRKNMLVNMELYKNNNLAYKYDLINKRLIKDAYAGNLKFKKICIYDQAQNLECKSVDEFVRDLSEEGYTDTEIIDILTAMQNAWDELGLQGDVMVQCGSGLLGVSGHGFSMVDITRTGKVGKGKPTMPGTSGGFKQRVDNACSQASLGNINGGGGNNGGGVPGAGGVSRSPNQGLVDNAVGKMDQAMANCRDGGNSLIQLGPAAVLSFLEKIGTVIDFIGGVIGLHEKFSEDDRIASFTDDDGSKVDVYKTGTGEYHVVYGDEENMGTGEVQVNDRRGGGYVASVRYTGANGRGARETCNYDANGVEVSCKHEISNCVSACESATDWQEAPPPTDDPNYEAAKAATKEAAKDVDCAKRNASGGECNNNPAPGNGGTTPPPTNQGGGKTQKPNPDGGGSKCDAMRQSWERFKAECEQAGWQTFKCIEFVRFWNKCAGDIRVAQPTPDGDLYFGCPSNMSDAEAREKECERKKMIWLTGIDGLNSKGDCKKPSDLSLPGRFTDPCGPEAQPDPERGCNPIVNVPSENPRPGLTGPTPSQPFINDKFGKFMDYSMHNKYHSQLERQTKGSIETSGITIMDDDNYAKTLNMSKPVMVIFASNFCTPSINYLNSIKSNLKGISSSMEVRVVNVEQNPELFQKYKIQVTPTTLVINNSAEKNRLIGIQSNSILQQSIK
jgi:antitoxin component YwqK of YwqJK toxin-antitoxin module/thiol-disulfide isomerase/thioredoxin